MAATTNTPEEEFGVFLCFRGPDSRLGFTSYLYEDMAEKGIHVFLDNEELGPGREKKEIFEAIDKSQIYMPIFSKGFASSSWCLAEIERMVQRTSDPKSKKVMMPIFLDLPNDDLNLTKFYRAALDEHRKEEMIDIISELPENDDNKIYKAALVEHRKEEMIAIRSDLPKDDVDQTKFYGAALDEHSKGEMIPILSDLLKDNRNLIKFYGTAQDEHRKKEMFGILVDLPKDAVNETKSYKAALDECKKEEMITILGDLLKDDVTKTKFRGAAFDEHYKEEIFSDLPDVDIGRYKFYRAALDEHRKKKGPTKVDRRMDALKRVQSTLGLKVDGENCGKLIKSLVRDVQIKLKVKDRFLPDHLVETDDLDDIELLMDVDSDDNVRFVVLHGTGGIGKSTLASTIFKKFWPKFVYSSFLEVEGSSDQDLLRMQKKLLSDTLGSTSADKILDSSDGIHRIKDGLGKKKVLVVLDNVDDEKQLQKLAGRCDWFGAKSKIIVTVRDVRLIPNVIKERPSNYWPHEVKLMPLDAAIKLFSKYAFTSDARPENWEELSKDVVLSTGSLPLTLTVVGPLFNPISGQHWRKTLNELKQVPDRSVRDTLMISFNKLDPREKTIFLEIACYCVGEDKTKAFCMWEDCGYIGISNAIDALCFMSLIKINENNTFWMHDELRDLGRYIVNCENFPGKRLWLQIDQRDPGILRSNEVKDGRALSLVVRDELTVVRHELTPGELARWPKLTFLEGEMNFKGDFKNSLHKLRWLSWHHCPPEFTATNLHPENMVVLDVLHSNITEDWGGWSQIKVAKKLKVLDLSHSKKLIATPDSFEFGQLEKLILSRCEKLSTIDSSIGGLQKLTHLLLTGCKTLFKLPDSIGNLTSLVELDLERSGIGEISRSIENLKRLKVIKMGHTPIEGTSCDIGQVEMLEELHAQHCYFLVDEFLSGIGRLTRLRILNLYRTRISTVPPTIGQCSSLQTLIITSQCLCPSPGHLPSPKLPSSLECLLVSSVVYPILPDLSNLVHLYHLEVWRDDFYDFSGMVVGEVSSFILQWDEDEVVSPWEDAQCINRLPRGLSILRLDLIPQLPNFSDFESLSFLYIHRCPMQHFPELEPLERLRELEIWRCKYLESTPDLSSLRRLRKLRLTDLPELAGIPGLGELEPLKFLHITDCNAIEQLPNPSKLINLRHIKLDGCKRLRAIDGLKALKEVNTLMKVEIKRCPSLEETDWGEDAEHTVQSTASWHVHPWKQLTRIMHHHNHAGID